MFKVNNKDTRTTPMATSGVTLYVRICVHVDAKT